MGQNKLEAGPMKEDHLQAEFDQIATSKIYRVVSEISLL